MLFNSLASRSGLGWAAISRGIVTELGFRNVGPISPYALERLRERGAELEQHIRSPLQLEERDLLQADLIIALNEPEHRPYLEALFPNWAARVEYWRIPDLDLMGADEALLEMEREVQSLLRRLSPRA